MNIVAHVNYLMKNGTTWMVGKSTAESIKQLVGNGYSIQEFRRRKKDHCPMGYYVQSLDFIQRQQELKSKGWRRK